MQQQESLIRIYVSYPRLPGSSLSNLPVFGQMWFDVIVEKIPVRILIFARSNSNPGRNPTTIIGLSRLTETRMIERTNDFVASGDLVERAIEHTRRKCQGNLEPEKGKLALNRAALQENQARTAWMPASVASVHAPGALT